MNKAYRGAYERMADEAIANSSAKISINWINMSNKESGSGGADRITKKLIATGYRPDGASCAPEVREAYEAGRKMDGKYIRLPQETWRLTDETPAAGTAGGSETTK